MTRSSVLSAEGFGVWGWVSEALLVAVEAGLIQFSFPWWGFAVAALVLIVLAVVVIKFVKKIVVNTVLGVLALLAINFFGSPYGLKVNLNLVTVVVSALLGLAGVGALIILALLGIKV